MRLPKVRYGEYRKSVIRTRRDVGRRVICSLYGKRRSKAKYRYSDGRGNDLMRYLEFGVVKKVYIMVY
jgi:hypothetical protein